MASKCASTKALIAPKPGYVELNTKSVLANAAGRISRMPYSQAQRVQVNRSYVMANGVR